MTESLAVDIERKLRVEMEAAAAANAGAGAGAGAGTADVEAHTLSSDLMDLYSRQIGAYGIELMGKLARLQVLLVGLSGCGIETAKNLILAGPKQVVIHDTKIAAFEDLGCNFYLTEEHVEQKLPRAQACLEPLSTLNPYVDVSVHDGELNEAFVSQFHVVAVTSALPLLQLQQLNEFCRQHSIKFIFACNLGVTSTLFSDFGHSHTVGDVDGEPTRMNVVEHISEHGIVTISGDRHRLDDDDHVKFEELEGVPALNESETPFAVTRIFASVRGSDGKQRDVLVPNQFKVQLPPGTEVGDVAGGLVSQVKVPRTFSFRSLSESIVNPVMPEQFMGLPHMDMNKLLAHQRSSHLHLARLAVFRFQALHNGELPRLHSEEDATRCVELARQVLEEHRAVPEALVVDDLDEDVIKKMSLYARCELPGFAAFLGGVVAQEVLKAPGKFRPLSQWLHHDAIELLADSPPTDALRLPNEQPTRYEHQIRIFGRGFQERLMSQKWFLVGAGALGCEYLKGMALMGLGCGGDGCIHVTDMDRIEVSNLNRQFLFRRDNVGQPKSVCASAAAKLMNPHLKVHAYEVRVGASTEDVFDDAFWSSLDGVWNALDNVVARRYTDSKCVLHERPLLESGTLGTKANCETILPHQTQSYSQEKEQEEDSIPMCTLRNFPHFPEHCIEWARAQFSDLFEEIPSEFNALLSDPQSFFLLLEKEGSTAVQLEQLRRISRLLDLTQRASFQLAVELAVEYFNQQFRDRILDLVHAFPREARKTDSESGADLGLFWSGEKRFPSPAQLDSSGRTALHTDFLVAAANLFAYSFGIPTNTNRDEIVAMAAKVVVPAWVPPEKSNIILEEDEKKSSSAEEEEASAAEEEELRMLHQRLKAHDFSTVRQQEVAEFEKDDDTNFHIDFITATSNLRAANYRIKQTSRHQCKMIAGKIIPALATTTAMITGLVELELYKVVLGLKADAFANANVNLAVNSFQSFAPLEPSKATTKFDVIMCEEIRPVPDGFTVWDKVKIKEGDITLGEFVSVFKKVHFGCEIQLLFKEGISDDMISEGKGKALYNANPFLPAKMKETFELYSKRNLKELYQEVYEEELPESRTYLVLDATATDKERNSVTIPKIIYYFKA